MGLPHKPETPAIILCHGAFDKPHGKTAHGLLRFGRVYDIVAVIDRELSGKTARDVNPNFQPVPILRSVSEAIEELDPEVLLIGAAPPGGKLTPEWKEEDRSCPCGPGCSERAPRVPFGGQRGGRRIRFTADRREETSERVVPSCERVGQGRGCHGSHDGDGLRRW